MRLDFATPADLNAILGLIEEASRWLKVRGQDQWAVPWPNRVERDARVLKGLANRKTVIVRQGDTAVATVTIANWHNPKVWVNEPSCTADLSERAVYLHRLITARKYAGHGLGESLINWAEKRARAKYRAQWTRIDVWKTNTDLHRYYEKLGFRVLRGMPRSLVPVGSALREVDRPPEGACLCLSSLSAPSSRPALRALAGRDRVPGMVVVCPRGIRFPYPLDRSVLRPGQVCPAHSRKTAETVP